MSTKAFIPYAPFQTIKPFADQVWVVDGPEIGMDYFCCRLPFPTRMTVVRLPSGRLWLHSPVAWNPALASAFAALGEVRHLIVPSTLHYWHLPDWRERYPDARTYGAPNLAKRAKRPLALDETLGEAPPASWEDAFNQCVVAGPVLSEVDFFHRASRTLILTDLIENFEPERVRSRFLRWLIRAAGAADPDGKAPIDMQLSFSGRRRQVREAVEHMLSWSPERIVIAHGRCYDADGCAELRRAFRWVL